MKRFVFALILSLISTQAYAQRSLNYGIVGASLNTASTGAVTGTAFAIPPSNANIISWQVVAAGSALSVNLEGSLDNSTYSIIDTQTTATGGLKNYGPTSMKFVRCSAVSRTGGTTTTCNVTVNRGLYATVPGNTSTRFLAGDGTAVAPSFSFLSAPTNGFYLSGPFGVNLSITGGDNIAFGAGGPILNAGTALRWGSSGVATPDTNLCRGGPGVIGFGGCTSLFPALKRSGTQLQVRLGDDSASSSLLASFINLNNGGISLNSNISLISTTAPTISSGFGTSPTVPTNNGTASFSINVGTGGVATTGIIGLPTATNGWNCYPNDITTTNATVFLTKQTASTTTSATISNFTTAGALGAWAASDIIVVSCFAR